MQHVFHIYISLDWISLLKHGSQLVHVFRVCCYIKTFCLELMIPADYFLLPPKDCNLIKIFVCQNKTPVCLEITTKWFQNVLQSLSAPVLSWEHCDVSKVILLWLHNSPESIPPSYLSYHLCDWKQGPLRGRGNGAGSVPPRRTQIRIMSQIWQTRSLYRLSPSLAVLWVRTVRELTGSLPIGPRCNTWKPSQSSWLEALRITCDDSEPPALWHGEAILCLACPRSAAQPPAMTTWCLTAAGKHECFSAQSWHSLSVRRPVFISFCYHLGPWNSGLSWFSGWITSCD